MKYDVQVLQPSELSEAEIARCVSLVNKGGALAVGFGAGQLRQSRCVCLIRYGSGIVGLGVIKLPRPQYASRIAERSGFDFDKNTLELGYLSRDPCHKGSSL